MSVYEDMMLAKDIVNNNRDACLHTNKGFIYKCTNENMRDSYYSRLLKNNEKTLTVIGSGDQVLNLINFDSYNIDAFDISRFPKYFLELKLAAVKTLCYEEYFKFFYDKHAFSKKLYKQVIDSMKNEEAKDFWSNLANYRWFKYTRELSSPRKVYNSRLFSNGIVTSERAKELNPFLSNRYYYDLLKSKVNDANINYLTGDIYNLELDDDYDFVNLSNICMYGDMEGYTGESKYKNFVTNLKVRDNAKVLSYLQGFNKGGICERFYSKFFKDDDRFELSEVKNPNYSPDALLVYKKVR